MASFKAKFPVLQELFAKNHGGPFAPPPAERRIILLSRRSYDIVRDCTTQGYLNMSDTVQVTASVSIAFGSLSATVP